MNVGIVGADAAKFTQTGEREARRIIRQLLAPEDVVLVSGGCHLGGIDIWAEEEYEALRTTQVRPESIIHLPKELRWSTGYRPRDLLIAETSAVVHNITVGRYPVGFIGRRFAVCYHCERRFRETEHMNPVHVKSGGCWTAREAEKLGKIAQWYVVANEEDG